MKNICPHCGLTLESPQFPDGCPLQTKNDVSDLEFIGYRIFYDKNDDRIVFEGEDDRPTQKRT